MNYRRLALIKLRTSSKNRRIFLGIWMIDLKIFIGFAGLLVCFFYLVYFGSFEYDHQYNAYSEIILSPEKLV